MTFRILAVMAVVALRAPSVRHGAEQTPTTKATEALSCVDASEDEMMLTGTFEGVFYNISGYGQTFDFSCGSAYRSESCSVDGSASQYVAPDDYAYRTVTWTVNTSYDNGWTEYEAGIYHMNVYTYAADRPEITTSSTTYGPRNEDGSYPCGTDY